MSGMGRREFVTLLGGAAAWPFAARAQKAGKVVRIGFLGAASASGYANQVTGFRAGLRDLGYVEGTNAIIEYRWAEGNYERLPGLVADLIRFNVDVIAWRQGFLGFRGSRTRWGAISLSMASHLPVIPSSYSSRPVRLPPGSIPFTVGALSPLVG